MTERSYNADGREIGVCRACGAEHRDDAWIYRVTCPACRPPGIEVEPHALIGRIATRIDSVTGEPIRGRIVIVETRASGHAMLGLDVDQHEYGSSLHAASYYTLARVGE